MYDLIADNYSLIFPLETEKLNFITSYCTKSDMTILDVGCATGDLAIELAKKGYAVSGIDLNERMIDIAQNKIADTGNKADFRVADMMHFDGGNKYDHILCLGNTLPHIPSWEQLSRFFNVAYKVLNDDGYFIFQILNYDKVLGDRKIEFKIIENNDFSFKRNYTKVDDDEIEFEITFYEKNKKKEYMDSTRLLPITKERLLESLKMNGFEELSCFSDYTWTKNSPDDFYNVYVAKKAT